MLLTILVQLFLEITYMEYKIMGKRKRRADKNKAPSHPVIVLGDDFSLQDSGVAIAIVGGIKGSRGSFARRSNQEQYGIEIKDIIPYAPPRGLQSKQALLMDAPDSSLKRSPGHESPHHQNHGSSRRILLRHSRHPFGRHYSRRGSSNYSDASPSNWKALPVYDSNLSFKPESKDLSAFQYRGSRIFQKPERIRSSSLVENSIWGDERKLECRICQKSLRKHPFMFENSSSTDLSVVAVLVCGHVYHAECLEQKTRHEDSRDPPCPLCVCQT
ncbi:uncharacterized protein LOC121805777 isoform X2 [Salvia splendens]|uniref:uncharacterized protein LOC121805777 isoform X2 n=1 Tax=Salvia splendens TaxID=180675 RepID=UPI001C2791EE|nr:uncharacterized protein LOC121805777 isoform X2 [Salvia splendens]